MRRPEIKLKDFRPRPQLVTKATEVKHPRFPVIDAHNHLGEFGGGWHARDPMQLLARLDEAHVKTYIDLDGGWGEDVLEHRLKAFKENAPDRFVMFGGPGWANWKQDGRGFGEKSARRYEAQVQRGAQGLKIWKDFGLHVRDEAGILVSVDDPILDPLWETAGRLKTPVLVHVADPVAFFDPIDNTNERIEELGAHPDWHFLSPPFPSFMSIMNAFARVVERHPNTTFIGAHVGCYAENLAWVGALLERCPNFNIDISARIGELGRQPFSARRFFQKYQDRILFGIDAGPDLATYRIYWRFLETEDEYFDYDPGETPAQGRWQIYGLNLPNDVLEKVYYRNAARLMGIAR